VLQPANGCMAMHRQGDMINNKKKTNKKNTIHIQPSNKKQSNKNNTYKETTTILPI
jgi:hypothetical protein